MIHRVHFCTKCGMMKMDRGEGMDAKKIGALIVFEREIRLDERLKSVEKKLDEHNGYASKFETIQIDIAKISTEIKNIKEAI